MTRREAEQIVERFASKRVLVVGDLMVDEYIGGSVSRVSPEAPVLVLNAQSHVFMPGGAANVVAQIRALGAEAVLAGVVGRDVVGERLIEELRSLGADTSAVVVAADRPTTQKTRIVAGAQQVVRVDREVRAPLPPDVADALAGRAAEPASATFYAGADVAQFNKHEADLALGTTRSFEDGDETFHAAGTRLCALLAVRRLLITRGAQGLTLFDENGGHTDIPARRVDVFDGTGAGDSTISGLTLALAAGASPVQAAAIGNAAGGAVVRKVGVATAAPGEILALFDIA
jgi:bifunctional ADP-heptose synthase (sugar kinase/adenylyltransferase)